MISFKEWKNIIESQKDEMKCPHPEDKEFCRKWRLYINGEGEMPIHKSKASIGHYRGPRAGIILSKHEKNARSKGKKGSRSDWRKDY